MTKPRRRWPAVWVASAAVSCAAANGSSTAPPRSDRTSAVAVAEADEPAAELAPGNVDFDVAVRFVRGKLERPSDDPVGFSARLCGGDEHALSALFAATRAAKGELDAEPAACRANDAMRGGNLLRCAPSGRACAGAAQALASEGLEDLPRAMAFGLLARCRGDRYAALFERPEAPAVAVIELAANGGHLSTATLARALERAISARAERRTTPGHECLSWSDDIERVVAALARNGEPDAIRAIEKAYADATDDELREHIARGLFDRAEPALARIRDERCARARASHDRRFSERCDLAEKARRDLAGPIDLKKEIVYGDLSKFLPGRNREVVSALEGCVKGSTIVDSVLRFDCLFELAAIDRGAAASLVAPLERSFGEEGVEPAALRVSLRALGRFPDRSVLEEKLRGLSMVDPDDGAFRPRSVTVPELLRDVQRALWYEQEADALASPSRLFLEVSWLAHPALARVSSVTTGPQLCAQVEGETLCSGLAESPRDLPPTIARFTNALLRRMKSPIRIFDYAAAGGTWFVAGPPPAVAKLRAEELLPPPAKLRTGR